MIHGSAEDFVRRFTELSEEAKSHGLAICVCLVDDDPIGESEAFHVLHMNCPCTLLLGMAERIKLFVARRIAEGHLE